MKIFANSDYNLTGFSLKQPAFAEFERRVLGTQTDLAAENLAAVKSLRNKLDKEDGCLYADVEITKTYFEKLSAIAGGVPDRDLFREINQDALNFYRMHDYLNSKNLFEVCLAAGISIPSVEK